MLVAVGIVAIVGIPVVRCVVVWHVFMIGLCVAVLLLHCLLFICRALSCLARFFWLLFSFINTCSYVLLAVVVGLCLALVSNLRGMFCVVLDT